LVQTAMPNFLVGCPLSLWGFSMGAMPAQKLAQTRAGAKGALLLSGCVPIGHLGQPWRIRRHPCRRRADPGRAGQRHPAGRGRRALAVASVIESGRYDRRLRRMRTNYAKRRKAVVNTRVADGQTRPQAESSTS